MKNLKLYNQKRNFKNTLEPIGKKGIFHKKLRFVVQHHLARKDHFDFRLEWNGVLISFAIPKGPSYNPKDKRLAIHVEDHPLAYRNFEGIIPQGEYGGGTVMLWDEGFWKPKGDFDKDFKNGMIKFSLYGKRLQGDWALVFLKDKQWLLIKEKDGVSLFSSINQFSISVRSGKTMDEIKNGKRIYQKIKTNFLENISITSPQKVIFKNPKITKLDILKYYESMANFLMPYLEKRLISTIRMPDGVGGKKFFKKHLETKSMGIGKKKIPSETGKKEDYYYIKNENGLLSEVQMNSYEFHIWGSQITHLNRPDILVFDLDPDEKISILKVRQGVKDLKSILDELSLISFLKTSGGKGYHVVVPIQSLKNFDEAREFSKNIATIMEMKWPDRYTSNVRLEKRKGKIFIDWIRNTKGATSVAPYSIRLKKKASVSMPIRWNELDKIKPNEITLEEAMRRRKLKNPWENFFDIVQ